MTQIDIPLSRELIIKDKIDWNIEDNVDIEAFVEDLGDHMDLNDEEKDKLEADLCYQLIDHIESTTLRTRMTKEQKLMSDKLKMEEKERELRELEQENSKIGPGNRRKLMGRGAELGIARRVTSLFKTRNAHFVLISILGATLLAKVVNCP